MGIAVALAAPPILQFFDNEGHPAVGGTLLTQVGGLNYPTYSDSAGTIPFPNPIPLNSRGEISTAAGASSQLFLATGVAYTFTLFDAAGNQLNQSMYVTPGGVSSSLPNVASILALATPFPAYVCTQYYAVPGDMGQACYYWSAGSTATPDKGSVLKPTSIGGGAGRYLLINGNQRINIRQFGAVGDGVTDDSAAIQSAINANLPLFFPPGDYYIGSTALLLGDNSGNNANMNWQGSGIQGALMSRIKGSMPTPLVYRNGVLVTLSAITGNINIGTGSSVFCNGIAFDNDNQNTGSCMQLYNMVAPILIEANSFQFSFRGLECFQPFTAVVLNNKFNSDWITRNPISSSNYADAVALIGFQTKAYGNDFSACGTAIRLYGPGVSAQGNRIEVCGLGISVGGLSQSQGTFGGTIAATNFYVGDNQFEACEDFITVNSAAEGRIADNSGTSTVNGPGSYDPSRGPLTTGPGGHDGTGSRGLTVMNSSPDVVIENNAFNGNFRKWAYNYGQADSHLKNNVGMSNVGGTGYGKTLGAGITRSISRESGNALYHGLRNIENALIYDKVAALLDSTDQFGSHFGKLLLSGIVPPDLTKPPVYPRNTCGTLLVPNGNTTATYTFLTAQGLGNAAFNGSLSSSADGGSTLVAGDYYVAVTILGPRGETGVDISAVVGSGGGYQKITITSGQKITIPVFGIDARLKHRAYIGRTLGNFEGGFLEFAGGTGSLDYNGTAAYTGYGVPPPNGDTVPSMQELDANYFIEISPNWDTRWYISAKSTSAFTVTFSVGPSGDQTAGWLMYRP